MENLGSTEELILLAVETLGANAYGIRIGNLVGISSVGALYTTLSRLEQKSLIRARKGKPTAQRGGRAKTFYRLTPQGRIALEFAEVKRRRARGDFETRGIRAKGDTKR